MDRSAVLEKLKQEHPDATAEELERMCDEKMKQYAAHSNSIRGIEIFATGTHNGDKYTEKDIDDIVDAFNALDYRPAVKVGHTKDEPGAPSYGWIENLRKSGTKLLADFTDMHDSVVNAIRERKYDNVSSEIYFNLKRGGKTFRRALKAVALLGAEVPAVAGLVPLHKMQFAAEGEFEKAFNIDMTLDVSREALYDCFNERMAVLIATYSEGNEMKTKAQEMKELQDQLRLLQKQISDLSGKSDKEKDEQLKVLSAKVEEINKAMLTLVATEDNSTTTRELAQVREQSEKDQAALKEAQTQIAELQADGRRRQVSETISKLKVPAFRPQLEALFNYALLHNADKVKVYSKKDGKEISEDRSLLECTEALMSQINAQAESLFKQFGNVSGNDLPEGENSDLGVELDNRVKKYRADNASLKLSYEDATVKVFESDPTFAKKYREASQPRQTH